MRANTKSLYNEVSRFTNGSAVGLLQILVATAERTTFDRIVDCPTYPVPAGTAGLSVAALRLREAMGDSEVHIPTFLARLFASVRPISERKRLGQFFTAANVAAWALNVAPPLANDDICDAGAGTGVFSDAILRTGIAIGSYIGIENDPILALCAAHVLESINAPTSYKIWYTNFLLLRRADFKARGLKEPTLIIANPPFVRLHNLTGRARLRTALKSSLGIMMPPLSGSGSYFLSRAAELAGAAKTSTNTDSRNRRRLLFFFPKEAAGAKHARKLRDDLRQMHDWNSREHKIRRVQTGIDRHRSNALALLFVFEQETARAKFEIRRSRPVVCLGDVLQIRRGISTGCNDFFVLTDEDARRRKIPAEFLKKVLPTRIRIGGRSFSNKEWNLLRKDGHPCWLLDFRNCNPEDFENVQEYLNEGLRRGVHATPTAQALRTWFSIPLPAKPPDVFVTYFFRGAPRFILNEAGVFHLTNILGGRFISSSLDFERKKLILDSLNTQAERWMKSKTVGREYKGGLRKIEPRELSQLPIDTEILELVKIKIRAATVTSRSLFD